MAAIPAAERDRLTSRLETHAADRYSEECQEVRVRFRGEHAYVAAVDAAGDEVKLCRLSWLESGDVWRFAFYQYSREGYEPSVLPTGLPIGSPEDCFDCAAIMYLRPIA